MFFRFLLLAVFVHLGIVFSAADEAGKRTPPAPLIFDPITGNAGDPTVLYNHDTHEPWIFYTQRRMGSPALLNNTWYHGNEVGMASTPNGGMTWYYRGTAAGLDYQPGENSNWAPDLVYAHGVYHLYVSFLQGIPVTQSATGPGFDYPAIIVEYTGTDLFHWKLVGPIQLSSNRVIDPSVLPMPDGTWRMWYKDEKDHSHIWMAESPDLKTWKVIGAAVTDKAQEGPFAFHWQGAYWLVTDQWAGLGVYRSVDATHWTFQGKILDHPGPREKDQHDGGHANVLVQGDKAYLVYQCGGLGVIQVAPLEVKNGMLTCDRDTPFEMNGKWELAPEYRGGGAPNYP